MLAEGDDDSIMSFQKDGSNFRQIPGADCGGVFRCTWHSPALRMLTGHLLGQSFLVPLL